MPKADVEEWLAGASKAMLLHSEPRSATHCNTLQHTWSLQAHQKQCCDALSIAARHSF